MEERRLSGELKTVDAEGDPAHRQPRPQPKPTVLLQNDGRRTSGSVLPGGWSPCADTFYRRANWPPGVMNSTPWTRPVWNNRLPRWPMTGPCRPTAKQRLRDLEEQIAQLPKEARRPAALIEREVRTAEQAEKRSGNFAHPRRQPARGAETGAQGERKKLVEELAETGRKRDLHDRLAGLLGQVWPAT